jgi:hypothetical protein
MTQRRAPGSGRSGGIVLGLGAFGSVGWGGIVVKVVVGGLCGVSGLLGGVRDAGRVKGIRVLGSACKLPCGINGLGFLEVVTTP